jgi:hypothetical protein
MTDAQFANWLASGGGASSSSYEERLDALRRLPL